MQSSLRRSRLRALVQLVFPVSSLEFIVCLLRRRVCTTWLFDRIHRRVTIFVVVAVVGAASAGDSRAASARHAHSARALADLIVCCCFVDVVLWNRRTETKIKLKLKTKTNKQSKRSKQTHTQQTKEAIEFRCLVCHR